MWYFFPCIYIGVSHNTPFFKLSFYQEVGYVRCGMWMWYFVPVSTLTSHSRVGKKPCHTSSAPKENSLEKNFLLLAIEGPLCPTGP